RAARAALLDSRTRSAAISWPDPLLRLTGLSSNVRAEDHQTQYLEEDLGPDLRGVCGGIVFRRHLDDITAHEIDAFQAAQEFKDFPCRGAADLWRAGAGCESRIDAVDVEGQVGRPVPHDLSRLFHYGRY